MMSSNLEDCPNEIIGQILILLDFNELCNLRLSSRILATKVAQDRFMSHFRKKHVDITGTDLQTFVDMTQPDRIGCQLHHLILVGVVNNTKLLERILGEEAKANPKKRTKAQQDLEILEQRCAEYDQLHKSGTDSRLLTEAFSNLKANSGSGKLLSLTLKVVVYREDTKKRLLPVTRCSWTYVWKSAADTFHTAFRSLAESGLPVESLDIFNDRQLQRCSLAGNELGSIDFEDKGLAMSLASLKSLSVSFSDRVIFQCIGADACSHDPDDKGVFAYFGNGLRKVEDIMDEVQDENNFTGLGKLLQLCNQLEELKLHQYYLGELGQLTREEKGHGKMLQRATEIDKLPNLKRVELRGLYVSESDLLSFIKQTKVRHLSMYGVMVSSGRWASIFDYCTSDFADMEELYLDDLTEQYYLSVYFDGPGAPRFPPLRGYVGGSDRLERVGMEVKQPIVYRASRRGMEGSPYTAHYLAEQRYEYGPASGGYRITPGIAGGSGGMFSVS